MASTSRTATLWAPRVAGIAMSLFLASFALDAFNGKPLARALPEFGVHLAPALLVIGVVALAWRDPLVGAVGFGLLALAYAVIVRSRLDWIAVIAGPLAVVAVLFFVSWRGHTVQD